MNAMEWDNKASEFMKQGNIEEALRCIEEALKIEPHNELYQLSWGSILETAERYEEALLIYRQHMKEVPQSMNGPICISRVLNKLGRAEEARQYDDELKIRADPDTNPYTVIIDPSKDPLDVYINKIDTLSKLGRPDDATKIGLDFLNKFGDHPKIATALANIFYWQEEFNTSLKYCDQALKKNPKMAGALLIKAKIYIRAKHIQQALKFLKRIIKQKNISKNDLVEAYSTRGVAFIGLKQFSKAIQSIEEALKIDPTHSDSRGLLELAKYRRKYNI